MQYALFCGSDSSVGARLTFGHVDHSLGKNLWRLLRQVVPGALDRSMLVSARELLDVCTRIRTWRPVRIALKRDGGHGNDREFGKPLFDLVVFRFALSQGEPPAIVMDHDVDVIRVLEGRSATIERGIIEVPLGRSV